MLYHNIRKGDTVRNLNDDCEYVVDYVDPVNGAFETTRANDGRKAYFAAYNADRFRVLETTYEVGDFLAYTMVTDTRVYVVTKRTAKTLTIVPAVDVQPPLSWEDPHSPRAGTFKVRLIAKAAPENPGKGQVVRLRKDGTYRVHVSAHPLHRARLHNGYPVARIDYSF